MFWLVVAVNKEEAHYAPINKETHNLFYQKTLTMDISWILLTGRMLPVEELTSPQLSSSFFTPFPSWFIPSLFLSRAFRNQFLTSKNFSPVAAASWATFSLQVQDLITILGNSSSDQKIGSSNYLPGTL